MNISPLPRSGARVTLRSILGWKMSNMAHSRGNTKHGMSSTPEYLIWCGIRARCCKPGHRAYPRYGGRGIVLCERWQAFETFLSDMGMRPSPKHSVDRIDNNGSYSPENCRWATTKEQNSNSRHNRMVSYSGQTLTVDQWSKKLNISRLVLTKRLNSGWSIERAFTETVAARKSKKPS